MNLYSLTERDRFCASWNKVESSKKNHQFILRLKNNFSPKFSDGYLNF